MILLILPIMGGALVEGVNPKNILLSMVQEEEEEEEEHRPWKRKGTYCEFAYFSFRKRNKKQRKEFFFVSKKKYRGKKKFDKLAEGWNWLSSSSSSSYLRCFKKNFLEGLSCLAFFIIYFKELFWGKKILRCWRWKKMQFLKWRKWGFCTKVCDFFWEKKTPRVCKVLWKLITIFLRKNLGFFFLGGEESRTTLK